MTTISYTTAGTPVRVDFVEAHQMPDGENAELVAWVGTGQTCYALRLN